MYIATRRLLLRPITPADYATVHQLETDPAVSDRWRPAGRTVSPEEFVSRIWGDVFSQSIVMRRSDDLVVGLVTVYKADQRSGTAFLSALSSSQFLGSGLVVEALGAQIHRLFVNAPFRKLYLDVFEPNLAQFAGAASSILTEIGCLREDKRVFGSWVDRRFYEIDREAWLAGVGTFMERWIVPISHS